MKGKVARLVPGKNPPLSLETKLVPGLKCREDPKFRV